MTKKLKKLVTTLIITQILIISTGIFSTGLVAHADEKEITHLKEMTFDVDEILSLKENCKTDEDCSNGEVCIKKQNPDTGKTSEKGYCSNPDQDQAYLDSDVKFPVVAFILQIIDITVKIAGTIAIIMLILTGFVMLLSQGNQNAIEKAKQMFLHEIIGVAAIFLSYVIITLVQSIFTN